MKDLFLTCAHFVHTAIIWGLMLCWRDCEQWLCRHIANNHELWSTIGGYGLPIVWIAAIVGVNELHLRRWF